MAVQTEIGKLIEGDQERDAIHIAVAPVTAAQKLAPGQGVAFADDGSENVIAAQAAIGIVDPFLPRLVFPGQRFWMFLFPNTITSLKHNWTHPAFEKKAAPPVDLKAEAEQWMRDFADCADLGYSTVIEAGHEAIRSGDYFTQHDQETARDEIYRPGTLEAYWRSFEIITGTKVDDETREHSVFSCSC